MTSLFWKIHKNDKDIVNYFLSNLSLYEADVYDYLIKTLDLKQIRKGIIYLNELNNCRKN